MRKVITVTVMAFLFGSCNWGTNKKKVGFYDYSRVNYIYRLPLIEPYEITSPDNGASWGIAFKNNPPAAHGVQFLTNIGIQDSVFVVYSPKDLSFSSDHPQVWVVVDVANKEEKIFTNEKDYNTHLKNKGLKDIKLYEINPLYTDFDKNRKLPFHMVKK